MRRRAAKLLTAIRADSFDYQSADMDLQGDQAAQVRVELQHMAAQLQSSLADGTSTGKPCMSSPPADDA